MENEEKEEETRPRKITRFPFKKGPIPFVGPKRIDLEDKEKGKLKEPIALIINDNYDVTINDNVKPGSITVTRNGEDVDIMIPKSKILSFDWGGETIRGWIIDVKEAVALPTGITHDSLEIKRAIDAMQTNYKNYKTSQTKANWEGATKMILYIGGAIAIIFIAMAIAQTLGLDVMQILQPPAKEIVTGTPA